MRVAVYLGSHDGNKPVYRDSAYEFGRRLAQEGIGVVYGGANIGTMGALAQGVASAGGECIGVYPEGFKGRPDVVAKGLEIRQQGLTDFVIVKDFAERKQKMEDMSDCCVALPGSWGTMDELFAYTTSSQLQFNGGKKIFILNVNGFYDNLKAQLEKMGEEGFVEGYSLDLIRFCNSVEELVWAIKGS